MQPNHWPIEELTPGPPPFSLMNSQPARESNWVRFVEWAPIAGRVSRKIYLNRHVSFNYRDRKVFLI
jgi:hypothetical protein